MKLFTCNEHDDCMVVYSTVFCPICRLEKEHEDAVANVARQLAEEEVSNADLRSQLKDTQEDLDSKKEALAEALNTIEELRAIFEE